MEFKDYAKKIVGKLKENLRGEIKTTVSKTETGEVSTYIVESEEDVWEGTVTYGTVGLLTLSTGYVYEHKPLVNELMAVVNTKYKGYGTVLGSVVTNAKYFGMTAIEGSIHKDVIGMYYPNEEMKHVVLTQSMYWEGLYTLDLGEKVETWLLAIPISDGELEYLETEGMESLLNIFEEKGVYIADLNRDSVV